MSSERKRGKSITPFKEGKSKVPGSRKGRAITLSAGYRKVRGALVGRRHPGKGKKINSKRKGTLFDIHLGELPRGAIKKRKV